MKKILLTCTAFAMAMASWAQVPKADVLDVVFNADGTATDVSEMANEISVVGTPKIVTSDQFGMNVLCTASETIGGQNNNTFVIPMTEQIWSAIADGHTMECFVRPFWEGGLNKKGWSTLMGFQQSGGAGMLLYYGEWCYEPHIGGGYHDAWGGAPEFKQWAHVVGVMDGENNCTKIYVNGQLMQTLETSGTLGRPNVGSSPFIALAGDLSGSGVVEACFTGDMAIARMYSKALTDEEVQTLYNEIKSKDTGAEDHKEEGQFPNLRYDENGAVIIETAEDMHDFALLSKVAPYTNAEVVADIDYTGYNENISYYGSNAYAAVFNGNGHTITVNFDFSGTETTGFVADAVNGAVIKDLTLEGNVKADQRWCGILFGENYGATAQNITIRANLHSDYAGACYNGVLSGWDEKTCTYENIVIESTLSGTGTYMGGLIGDVAGTTYLKNILVVTDANVDDKTQNSPLIAKPRSGANFDNVYFVNKGGLELSVASATEITMDEVNSGAACFMLNKGNITNPIFYQNIQEDDFPTMNPESGIVVRAGNEYTSVTADPESMSAAQQLVATNEEDYALQAEAYQGLKDALMTEVQAIKTATTLEEFVAIYAKIQEIRNAIDANQKAYEELKAKAEEILPSLEGMTSNFALQLIDYLQEEIEPNDTYINGSYVYIYENKTLDTEGVYAEISYMEDLQKRITAADAPAGTDVTVLLNNPDFSNGFAGWNGDDLTNYGTNGNMWAAENYGKRSFNIYQELSGLKNGIYLFRVRGGYRPFNDQHANQYNAILYANGNANYIQTLKEGMIPVEEAVDKENCYISAGIDNILDMEIYDAEGNVIGYTLQGIQSCCYAFQAGRFPNYVAVNVTDGTLRVGVDYNYSDFGKNEWIGIGDMQLIYCGTVEEATEGLNTALESMLARAATLMEYEYSDGDDCYWLPNYSSALKDRVSQIMQEATKADATEAEKYAWIEELGSLYQQIIASKQGYSELAGVMNRFYDRIADYPEHMETIQTMADAAWDAWRNGAYATDAELKAKAEELTSTMDGFSVDVPAADVLDLVYNLDGTITDKSAMQNEVQVMDDVRIKESPMLGQNVLCLSHNKWGENAPAGHLRIPATEAFENAISDGVTLEAFVRPTWEGDVMPSAWTSVLGNTESGGMCLIVYNGAWTYEIHAGGSYCDAMATRTPVVKDKWVHVVGVWNKEEGTAYIYLDGEFAGSVAADGDFKPGYPVERYMAVGADMANVGYSPQASFQGDIAIARIYDQPLNGSQVNKLYKSVIAGVTDNPEHDCADGNAIRDVNAEKKTDTGIFNIMGQKVSRMTKGLYIINGKKVLVK